MLQPPSPRRAYGAAVRPFLDSTRQLTEVIGSGYELAEACRSDVSGRVEKAAQRLDLGYFPFPSQPMNVWLAHRHFYIRSGLVQQGSSLQGALSTAYNQNTFA